MKSGIFELGDKVRINDYGLDWIYDSVPNPKFREKAASKVFIVIGYGWDGHTTRVQGIACSPKAQNSYADEFLELTNKLGKP